MSTHGSVFSIRKDECQPHRVRCTVPGVLLVTLLLVLFPSSFAFAYAPRIVTVPRAFTPPTQMNVALDEVSIVRVIATYSGAGSSPTLCTGLGAIVGSWPQTNPTAMEQNNLILTSGSVVSTQGAPCGSATEKTSKQFRLQSLQILFNTQFNDGKTLYSESRTNVNATDIQCADKNTCSAGMTLFSLSTRFANPFITISENRDALTGTAGQGQNVQIALARNGVNAFLPPNDAALSNASEAQAQTYRSTVSQYMNALAINSASPQDEPGLVTIDGVGNMTSLLLSGTNQADAHAISTFLIAQPEWVAAQNQWQQQNLNTVQGSWRTGIQQYYMQKNFTSASAAFAAAAINTNFVGAREFATIAAHQQPAGNGSTATSSSGANPSSSQTTIPFTNIHLPWWQYVAIAVVALLLVIVVVLVIVLIRRSRKVSPGFARDLEEAYKEVWQKQQSGQLAQPGQPIQQFSPSQPYNQVSEAATQPMQPPVPQTVVETPVQSLSPAQVASNQAQYANQTTWVDNSGYATPPHIANQPTLVNNNAYNPPSEPQAPQPPSSIPAAPAQQSPALQAMGPTMMPEPTRYEMEDQTVPNVNFANGQAAAAATGGGHQGKNLGFVAEWRTDPGIKRKYKPNEDSMFAAQGVRSNRGAMQPFGLFVVADGMGGHANGQDASRLAIQTITNYMLPILTHNADVSGEGLKDLLRDGVQQANQAVHKHNMEQRADMGTTMTAALVVDRIAYIANVGDSRTYLYREGMGLMKITQDHSVVASLVDAGIIKPDDIYTHPKRNQIYRSLGEKPVVEVDAFTQELQPGDKLLLCSDGLWDMVRDPQIATVLQRPFPDLGKTGDALIDAALNGGGDDNVSVIVVQVTTPANPDELGLDVRFLYSPETYVTPQL